MPNVELVKTVMPLPLFSIKAAISLKSRHQLLKQHLNLNALQASKPVPNLNPKHFHTHNNLRVEMQSLILDCLLHLQENTFQTTKQLKEDI